jgi:hypothetical protein
MAGDGHTGAGQRRVKGRSGASSLSPEPIEAGRNDPYHERHSARVRRFLNAAFELRFEAELGAGRFHLTS